ncbi:lysogenization regulator HflD, partial [bacterium]|nr:lysogenization regulator HflD [bacterium]
PPALHSRRYTIAEEALAIAAALIALRNIDALAKRGNCDEHCTAALMASVFCLDSDKLSDIYPRPESLRIGYTTLLHVTDPSEAGDIQHVLGYFAACTQLAKRLQKERPAQEIIRNRLRQHEHALPDYPNDPEPLNQLVAQLYTDCISPLKPRIQIKGQARHLGEPRNQSQVRALLVAAVRACYLWRQMGGRLWRLPLQRHAFVQAAKSAIDE